jgi:membrane protease YdiL (CAAX protease family)
MENERKVQRFSLARPVWTCVILFVIATFFRWVDTFVLRFDELLGELILTKSLGFILVLVWVWLAGRKLRDIGLHGEKLGPALLAGGLTTVVGLAVGFCVEMLVLSSQGQVPELVFGAIDPKMGVTGGIGFALWLFFGNIVNSFMEEGLFRGVMGRLGRLKFKFWGTILFTAFMFALWHLPWVAKYYWLGEIQTGGEIASSVVFNTVPQFLIGLVYGYLYLKTGSLWAPWFAHLLSNSLLNYIHISTAEGLDTHIPVRAMTYLGVMFLGLLWVRRLAGKNEMEEVEAWG